MTGHPPVEAMTRHHRPDGTDDAPGVRDDTGSVTLFLVITVIGLFIMAGLVVDAGARLRGIQQADASAAEAGRAAGQVIDQPSAITGSAARVDVRGAVAAAQAFLAEQGLAGRVQVSDQGRTVTVTVTTRTNTVFLGLIGIDTLPVQGEATVTLVRAVTVDPAAGTP